MDEDRWPTLAGSVTADTPTAAVRWVRIMVRTVVAVIPTSPIVEAWLFGGHQRSALDLSRGDEMTLTLTHGDARMRWTARPVLKDRRPTPAAHAWPRQAFHLGACGGTKTPSWPGNFPLRPGRDGPPDQARWRRS
ncbi:hypothetical protein [Actinacidiphila oryziradicis]|uniref:Uncharacterized protein n=1 Tax=Actinacidiphila oryziradicis TaxID=2571141 RepID=A0A4U0T8X5_9ACTN|nr:hypothetical protein [Actinacidiphila oryziradicis]TKA12075.1 hypothetical protein FCI23_07115 [Actinacidiphila oryziradicis]